MSNSSTRRKKVPLGLSLSSRPARVLLVEGRSDGLPSLESALTGLAATLVPVRSGDEVLAALLEGDCACVVLDRFETAQRIRSHPAFRDVPILFVTAQAATPDETARAYALGAVELLPRPFTPEALRAKVAFFVELQGYAREARETRTRYDTLSEIAPVGIFHTTPDGDCLWVNPLWCEFSGLSPEAAAGKGWAAALHPEDRQRVFDEWYRAAQQDVPFRSEYRFVRPDGRITWVLGQAKAERGPQGRVTGYVGTITDITDRRLAEQRAEEARDDLERKVDERTRDLSRSEERLRRVLEGSLDAVVTADARGVITGWNAQAERMFGWPPAEILGRPLAETIIPERYRDAHRRGMERLGATGDGPILGKRIELAALRRDGTEFPVELTITPLQSEGETSFSAFISDLTERRRAEEISDRLAAVVRSSEDAIVTKTLDGTITSWNSGAEATFGYRAAEAVGRPITILVPPELLDEEKSILEKISRGERVEGYETVRLRKDGSRVDVSITVAPLRDHEGRIVGASKIGRDITDRKRAQERTRFLAQAAEILGSSLDYERTLAKVADFAAASPLSDWCAVFLQEGETIRRVAVAHRDPAKLEWAREFDRRFPYDPQKDRTILEVLETGQPLLLAEISDELLRVSSWNDDHYRALKEAGIRSVMIVPMAVGGRVLGAISLVSAESRRKYTPEDLLLAVSLAERAALAFENARLYRAAQEDIARRKRVEVEVRELNARLEEGIKERTAKLSEAVRELEAFSYTVAHDLRAPLRAMSGLSRILMEDHLAESDKVGQDYARRIVESGRRMDTMVQDLLEYSRLSRVELGLERIELGGLVREVLAAMDAELQERKASVVVREPFPAVRAHRGALSQALTNLIQNAAKFVRPGSTPEIVLRAEERGDRVRVWVEDRGIGIAPEHRDRVFGVFQRLHDANTYPGTGIGLAIVRKAMERMGGRAGVESEPGQGSRFWLEMQKGGKG